MTKKEMIDLVLYGRDWTNYEKAVGMWQIDTYGELIGDANGSLDDTDYPLRECWWNLFEDNGKAGLYAHRDVRYLEVERLTREIYKKEEELQMLLEKIK